MSADRVWMKGDGVELLYTSPIIDDSGLIICRFVISKGQMMMKDETSQMLLGHCLSQIHGRIYQKNHYQQQVRKSEDLYESTLKI